ncbi:MAG: hypothetical protein AABO58_24615 [Acidobacteriota bacterium]
MNVTWLYVGALCALAVWLARRGGVELPRRVALLFYVLTVAFLFRPMTGDFVNIATDVPKLIPPWSASAPGFTKYQVSNFETQDVPMQLVPWMHQVREAWRHGRLPLWNELTGCGYTLLGNGQAQALSSLRMLALPLPLKYAITAEGAMKILIALTFTFLYCRRRGYGVVPSVLAAICFGFGPFVIVWLHFAIATTAVFLPAVLYAIDLLAETRTLRLRSGQAPARFAFMAVTGALVVFGGHPETGLHIAAFAALYALVMHPRSLGRFAAAAMVAVLLALPLLVAMGEAIPQSYRYQQVKQWSREVPFSDFPSLALLAQPRLFGRQNPAGAESITGFAGILGIAAWLAVAIDSVRKRNRAELFFVAASLFVFLVLANWHPATRVADVVFGLAANMRLRFLLAFMLAVLTAALVERVRSVALGVGLAFGAAVLLYVGRHFGFAGAVPSAIALVVATAMFFRWRFAPMLVLLAVTVEICAVTIGWNPVRSASTFYPRTPLIDAVTKVRGQVVGIGPVLFPNTNVIFGIEDVRFHDPMVPARYVQAMGLNANDYYVKWTEAKDFRWVLTEPGRDAPYVLRYDGPDGRLYENRNAKPRFYSDGAIVTVTIATPTDYTLVIDAAKPARIMSTVGWARGWQVSGAPASSPAGSRASPPAAAGRRLASRRDAGAPFVEFDVPAGHHVVRVRYRPLHIYAAFAVALATALALAAYIIRARV